MLLRSQSANGATVTAPRDWRSDKLALVICDRWDSSLCVSAMRRAGELAPRVNALASQLRQLGIVRRDGAMIMFEGLGAVFLFSVPPNRQR